jgi:SpoVK/Ycf46/Vps4 family AAA+-type ATPase
MEIEKGLAGASTKSGGGSRDGGTTTRSTSQLLKFLSDGRPPGVYVVATCNDIDGVDPEWLRAGRWDTAPWYVGLPDKPTQNAILKHYKKVYEVKGTPTNMDGWSGAEIEQVCLLASINKESIDITQKLIIPISVSKKDVYDKLEKDCKTTTLQASRPYEEPVKLKDRRKIKIK